MDNPRFLSTASDINQATAHVEAGVVSYFELREPVHGHSATQFREMQMLDVVRNNIGIFQGAPYGYYLVDDEHGGKEIFAYFQGDDIYKELERARDDWRQSSNRPTDAVVASARSQEDYRLDETARPSTTSLHFTSIAEHTAQLTREMERLNMTSQIDVRAAPDRAESESPFQIVDADKRSLIPIPPRHPRNLYCIQMKLDKGSHPDCKNIVYTLPLDTADVSLWFFGHGFKYVKNDQETPRDWEPRAGEANIWTTKMTIPPPRATDRTSTAFTFRRPQEKNYEAAIKYSDDGLVYVRNYPGKTLTAEVPGWDWVKQTPATDKLPLPWTLAYAANRRVVSQRYDGNFGLGIYNSRASRWFTGATFAETIGDPGWVHTPSKFLIRLLHPDSVEKTNSAYVTSFLSFGEYFPCNGIPVFGPSIPVKAGTIKWVLRLISMTLLVPRSGITKPNYNETTDFEQLPIDLDGDAGIDATLDSGSSASMLPKDAVKEIRSTWLLNSVDVNGNQIYCGPERKNLRACDIIFSFKIPGSKELVQYRCSAAPFLRSDRLLGVIMDEKAYSSEYRQCPILSCPEKRAVLGTNFYWTGFVYHSTPLDAVHTRSAPYVRLAPQRKISENGEIGYQDYHFTLPKNTIPRMNDNAHLE